MTFSAITIALLVTTAGFCFSAGWTARRISTSGRDVELKRNVYEAKGAIPQLESTLRNRDQRITMLTTEAQSLRDRLTQAEAAAAQKDTEIVKRDREIRLARSELQIVKDGSLGGVENPDLIDGADVDPDPHAEADPKIVIEMKRLEARYESLKKGLIQRDDRIATLEQELAGGPGQRSVQILEQELADLQAAAELSQATLAARDTLIRDLQAKLQADVEQRELLETLTKRRGDANRNLKENYTKLEAQLPKLMDTLKQRADTITAREASIALLDGDLAHVRSEKAEREATIVELEGKLAAQRDQIAQQTSNYQMQKQHLHQVEQRADMLAHEVAETTKALQTSHALVREREAAMEGKDNRLLAVDEKLREQGNTMASVQKLLKDRDFKIDSLIADLAGAEAKANAARDEVAKQLAANHALQRNLSKWEQRVATLTAALAESGNAAQANQAQAQERDVAVEERDARLRDIDTKVREQAEQIVSLQGVISARDDEVEALNADIAALRMKVIEASAQANASPQTAPLQMAAEPQPMAAVANATTHDVDEQAAANQRADRAERELNSNAREIKTMKTQLTELETRCASLDGLLRGKDASLTERARRIEDLQDQLIRLEARVDERNREITDLKRARDEAPPVPSPYVAARNNPTSYNPQSKPI